jgi:hypothetical protein
MLFDIDKEIDERRYILLMFALQASESKERVSVGKFRWLAKSGRSLRRSGGRLMPTNCVTIPSESEADHDGERAHAEDHEAREFHALGKPAEQPGQAHDVGGHQREADSGSGIEDRLSHASMLALEW